MILESTIIIRPLATSTSSVIRRYRRWVMMITQFIARGAYDVSIPSAFLCGQFQQLGCIAGGHHGLGYHRIVTVDDNIYFILLQHPDIGRAFIRLGHTEKNIRYFGGDHGSSPSIRQRISHGMQQDAHPVVIDAHVGAMHGFRGFAIDAPGNDAGFLPDGSAFFRLRPSALIGRGSAPVAMSSLSKGRDVPFWVITRF